MTKKDFVMAWLLAARAGSSESMFGEVRISHLIHQAVETYEKLEDIDD